MKLRSKVAIAGLSVFAWCAGNPAQALAQAEQTVVTAQLRARQILDPPVIEPVGPQIRMTVHVLWTLTASDPRLNGLQDITGVWMIDPRDGSAIGHGKWTSSLASGGQAKGSWCTDGSGTMHATGFVTGGELDGAILNIVSVAGHPLLGWVNYEVRVLMPARE